MHPVTAELKQRELSLATGSVIDAGYMHRAMCLAALPLKKPEGSRQNGVSTYERTGERCTLTITTQHFRIPGHDAVPIDVPHGNKPRLLILSMGAHANMNGASRYIEIGAINEWTAHLGISTSSDVIAKMKEQLISLSMTNFSAFARSDKGGSDQIAFEQKPLIEGGLFSTEDMLHAQAGRWKKVRWPEGIVLSASAWAEFKDDMVAIPMQCLRPIAHSSTAIDIFTYLCYRLPLIQRGETELFTYRQMNEQFGSVAYRRNPARFAAVYKSAIALAIESYKGANVEQVEGGLLLRHSDPIAFARTFMAVERPRPKRVRNRSPRKGGDLNSEPSMI